MTEFVSIYKPGQSRTHTIDVYEAKDCKTGEGVFRLTADVIYGRRTKPVRLVSKDPILFYDEGNLSAVYPEGALHYFQIWERLKSSGIPVVDNLWVANKTTVVMPDLTVKGQLYDKLAFYHRSNLYAPPQPIDLLFAQIPIQEITQAASNVLDHASSQRIALSTDDPLSMLVYPNGDFRIYALDIGLTMFNQRNPYPRNAQNLGLFLHQIETLQQFISERVD